MVQLLNVNRTPIVSTVATVRRRLFPADDDQLSGDDSADAVREMLEEILVQQQEKWCFNFVDETPLEGGRFQWEKITVDGNEEC